MCLFSQTPNLTNSLVLAYAACSAVAIVPDNQKQIQPWYSMHTVPNKATAFIKKNVTIRKKFFDTYKGVNVSSYSIINRSPSLLVYLHFVCLQKQPKCDDCNRRWKNLESNAMAVIKYIILKIYILLTVSILWIENNFYIFSRNMSTRIQIESSQKCHCID